MKMHRISVIFFIFCITLSSSDKAFAWFDCNWIYRSEISITEAAGTNLTDYQILINLSSTNVHADYAWSVDGQDLRVLDTDDNTELDFYIENWNATAKQAQVWVKVPSLPANSNKLIYFYYGNPLATPASTATITHTEPGIKFHTRNSTANPNNKASAFNAFNTAVDGVAGYGCKFITNFTGISNKNQFTPSTNSDFGAYSETFFEVLPGEEGVWSVRYGADFGRGGGLYVDDVALEEDWNNDLWWASNWGNPDVLEGSINLTAGYHHLEIIGFEGCCDGGITVQFRKPGGAYQTYSTSNINIVSRKCPTIEPTTTVQNPTFFPPELTISKNSQVVMDPINGTTLPKRITGAKVRYTIEVSNAGSPVDTNSINITDPIPASTELSLATSDFNFVQGASPSGLNFVYSGATSTTDNVSFSSTVGGPYNYIPSPIGNIDTNVEAFRVSPSGQFGCSNNPATPTSFSLDYHILID